jgi:hypothetical protein
MGYGKTTKLRFTGPLFLSNLEPVSEISQLRTFETDMTSHRYSETDMSVFDENIRIFLKENVLLLYKKV